MGTSISDYFATDNNGARIDKTVDIANLVTANFNGSKIEISSYSNSGYRWVSKLIELEKNTNYTINGEFSNVANICGFSSLDDNAEGTQLAYIHPTNKKPPQTFNSGNYNYYVLSIYPPKDTIVDKIKVEKGTKVTSYSPYGQGSIGITIGDGTTSETKALYTQQPFRAIGDVKDGFVKQNGVWYEEHNMGELILNGTESWSVARSLSSNLLLQIEITNLADLQSVNGIVSDYFIGTNGDFIWNVNDGKYYIAGNSSNKIRISLNITKFPTASSFTEWLKINNAKVYYQLATPTLIECTPEQVEVLNEIYAAYGEGMTNISCTDEVVPVIEIVKETKELVQSENEKGFNSINKEIEEIKTRQTINITTGIEVKTNECIDGKPIYLKRIDCGALPNASNKKIDTGLNFSTTNFVRVVGVTKNPTDNLIYPLPFTWAGYVEDNVGVLVVGNNIEIKTAIDKSAFTETYIDLYYTKN